MKEQKNLWYINQNELGKAYFQQDLVSGAYKDLPQRTVSDKVSSDKAFAIASCPKYDGHQQGIPTMIYKIFYKKSIDTNTHAGTAIVSENQKLANELHKPITRKFKKRKKHSSYKDNIWGAVAGKKGVRSKFLAMSYWYLQ